MSPTDALAALEARRKNLPGDDIERLHVVSGIMRDALALAATLVEEQKGRDAAIDFAVSTYEETVARLDAENARLKEQAWVLSAAERETEVELRATQAENAALRAETAGLVKAARVVSREANADCHYAAGANAIAQLDDALAPFASESSDGGKAT